MSTYSVWVQIPSDSRPGWSRVAGGLSQEEAERMASVLFFPARAMPDTPEGYKFPVGE